MKDSTNIAADLQVIFHMFEELLCSHHAVYDNANKTVNAEYVTLSYDLIDKDLDYDEMHHRHLLSSLELSLDVACKKMIVHDTCSSINVVYKNMLMRDRVVDVKQFTYCKTEQYLTNAVTCYTLRRDAKTLEGGT